MPNIIYQTDSLGGAAAALALHRDARIRAGIDLDGRLFDPVLTSGLDHHQPFLLLGREHHAKEDPTWNQFWRVLRGSPRAMLGVRGTTHASFTDIPALIGVSGLEGEAKGRVEGLLGTVGGGRVQRIVAEVCDAFFGAVFKGDGGRLKKVVRGLEEVVVVESNFTGK
jgi:hypothetical protein